MGTGSGSGLGLSVVYGVLKDHQGYFDILSKVDKGTEFLLYFPASSEEISIDKIIAQEVKGQESILVIDDQLDQRVLAKSMLSELGYQVTTVKSGNEAIDLLRTNDFDLILLDMIMEPGIDGLDTFRKINQLKPSQKTIIVSGYSESDRIKEACRLGVKGYIKKPYTIDIIGNEIRKIFDSQA